MKIADKLLRERRGRLAAERLLQQKQRELLLANQQLAQHARALGELILEERRGLADARNEAEDLKGLNTRVLSDLDRANAAAMVARRRLWAAVETFRDGFAIFDRDLRLVVANRSYLAAFRGHPAPVPGQSYAEVLESAVRWGIIDLEGVGGPDWLDAMMARIKLDRIPPKTALLVSGRHVRFMDRRSEDGDLVSLALDITDAMRREAELEEARNRAESANRAKSAFLANMSHEIRTPMNGVVGMAELLCGTELSDGQRLYAETIRSSGESLLTIINDVLDYSKIEAAKLRLYPEDFDLERCIHEIVVLLGPSARDKGLDLRVDFSLSIPTRFHADRGRLRQVLTNLIGNAVKFTEQGHVLIGVTGTALSDGMTELCVTVEDTGIGIAPEHADHVFGEFNQVEDQSSRRFEGTGLGLAITQRLIGLMNGAVWVTSQLGRGSVFGFRVSLPAAEPWSLPPRTGGAAVRKALVVEEGPLGGIVLGRQLEAAGVQAARFHSLAAAMRALRKGQRFDLLLIDTDAPDFDAEASRTLRGLADIPHTSCFLTASETFMCPDDLATGGILRKPLARSDLYAAIGAAVTDAVDAAPADQPQQAGLRRMRVLAAEDNRTNQLVFRKMVQHLAIDLEVAGNGREAVDLWASFRPDLIFMDISMPVMDGRAAARTIRAREAGEGLGHVPIVALTAHAMDGDERSILDAGIDHYLTKPLRKAAICERIAVARPPDALPPALPDGSAARQNTAAADGHPAAIPGQTPA